METQNHQTRDEMLDEIFGADWGRAPHQTRDEMLDEIFGADWGREAKTRQEGAR